MELETIEILARVVVAGIAAVILVFCVALWLPVGSGTNILCCTECFAPLRPWITPEIVGKNALGPVCEACVLHRETERVKQLPNRREAVEHSRALKAARHSEAKGI